MKFKLKYVMLSLALSVAGCAAYFSVWGLSQLFAGASTAVIIMASVLELGKIVTTTALHTYWNKLAKGLRTYLTISVVILMIITSAGIYGFLSNAYQKTANKLEIHEGELGVLETKKNAFEKSLSDNQKIVETKTKRLEQLSNLRGTQEARIDLSSSNRVRNSVRSDISNANSEIQKLSSDIDMLNNKNGVITDSINVYNVKMLELKSGSEVAAEVGPLKYIAELTGLPMAVVVNYLILLLIFVFDPLSIALILITNRVFQLEQVNDKTDKTIVEHHEEPVEDMVFEEKIYEEPIEEIEELVSEELKPQIDKDTSTIEEGIEVEEEAKTDSQTQPIGGRITVNDIKEVKERNRGYSVNIPSPKGSNTVERINNNSPLPQNKNNNYFKRK